VAAVPANCGWVLLENHGPRDQSASVHFGMHITIPQPFPACPLPAEQRCAILTDDSPNLGLANDPTPRPADATARPADATARSRPDASAGDPTGPDATRPDGGAQKKRFGWAPLAALIGLIVGGALGSATNETDGIASPTATVTVTATTPATTKTAEEPSPKPTKST